jgi:hypothetical protein
VLTAAYLPLNNWGLQGLEVSVLALLVTVTAGTVVRDMRTRRWSWWPHVLLGVGTFVRPDMVVLFVTVIAFLCWANADHRWRRAAIGLGILAGCVIVQTLLRWLYYGDILPNTYYLKMSGYPVVLRVARGFLVFLDFIFRSGSLTVLIPLGALLITRDRRLVLLIAMFAMQSAYSVYVGGDAWEFWGGSNRYISIIMPLCFAMIGTGFEQLRRVLSAVFTPSGEASPRLHRLLVRGAVAASVAICMVQLNAISANAAGSFVQWGLIWAPLHVTDNRDMVEMGLTIREITSEDATVAVVWAGAMPYFVERPAVDLIGKSDRTIARLPMELPPPDKGRLHAMQFFVPGHLKYDLGWSVHTYAPDVVAQVFRRISEPNPLAGYTLVNVGRFPLYLRNGSPHVLWTKVERRTPQTARRESRN